MDLHDAHDPVTNDPILKNNLGKSLISYVESCKSLTFLFCSGRNSIISKSDRRAVKIQILTYGKFKGMKIVEDILSRGYTEQAKFSR